MKRIAVLLACIVLAGCRTIPRDTIVQISTMDALLAGSFDGQMKCSSVMRHGDLGIGTFHELDGEMILLDGRLLQAKADGTTVRISPCTTTPFASVVTFEPDISIQITAPLSNPALHELLDARIANPNIPCAIKVTGYFPHVRVRSVPRQAKPYPPLADVAKTQPEFEKQNVKGALVGFRLPSYMKGINVPGYHLHFVADDLSIAGHVLSLTIASGTAQVDTCRKLLLVLPENSGDFGKLDLEKDRTEDMMAVEMPK